MSIVALRRSPVEAEFKGVHVALAAGADGTMQRFHYFLEDAAGEWRAFDIRELAAAAGVPAPFEHRSATFSDAWRSLTMAAAVFVVTWRDRLPAIVPRQLELL